MQVRPQSQAFFLRELARERVDICDELLPRFSPRIVCDGPGAPGYLNLLRLYFEFFADAAVPATLARLDEVVVLACLFGERREVSGREEPDLVCQVISGEHLLLRSLFLNRLSSSMLENFGGSAFPYFGNRQEGSPHEVRFSAQPRGFAMDEEVVFIGSRPNFGHFLGDHFALLDFVRRDERLGRLPLVTFRLTSLERELFARVGLADRLVEIDAAPGHTAVRLKSAWVPIVCPLLKRTFAVQRLLAPGDAPCPADRQPRIVFVSRRAAAGQPSRVANLREVEAYFASISAQVLFAEDLDVAGKAAAFGSADIVCCGIGSGDFNVLAFCPPSAVQVSLVPEPFTNPDLEFYYWSVGYHTYRMDRLVYVFGRPAGLAAPSYSRQAIDVPHEYPVAHIRRAIDEAVEMLAGDHRAA